MQTWEKINLGHEADTEQEMNAVLAQLFDEWHLEGEHVGKGTETLATVQFFRPRFGRKQGCHMCGARQALRGWRRLFRVRP